MKLAAALAKIAADAQPLPFRDAVLKRAADLRKHAPRDTSLQQRLGIAVDDPVVDAVGAPMFGYAHLVVGADVVDPRTWRHELLTTSFVHSHEVATFISTQHVRHEQDRRMVRHQYGSAFRCKALDLLERFRNLKGRRGFQYS